MNINNAIKSAIENYQSGNIQEAINICRKILEINPKNIQALHLLVIMAYQQKDYDSAIQYSKKLTGLSPNNAQVYYILGHSLQEKGAADEAVTQYRRSLSINPHSADAYYNLGTIFQDKKRNDEAISCYRKALQINPNDVDAYYNLGRVLQEKEAFDEAITSYQKALRINPHLADVYNNIGIIMQKIKRPDEALNYFQKALQINPNLADVYRNIGVILKEKKQPDGAIACFKKALELNPYDENILIHLGHSLYVKEQINEAICCFQKAIHLNPNCSEAYNNMGDLLIIQGKLDEGIRCFKKALEIKPDFTLSLLNLVKNQRLNYQDSKELLEITQELVQKDMSTNELIEIYFTMGKLCENLKMFKESFEYYRLGNTQKRATLEFNIDSQVDYLSRIKETFSAAFIDHRRSWGSESKMPIIIFGMPRSGTTLVEQIVASHPNVHGGGELQFFNQMDQKIPSILTLNEQYPEYMNLFDDQTAYNIAELYIKELKELSGLSDSIRVTNKNPFNFYYLGLIALLFPKASFIHCQRYPLDTCISIYFQYFSHGNYFAYDLSDLGQYYRAYLNLMNHWRRVLPINIFEVKYEDIVQHQEDVSRKLVEFCGLEWDSACLDFYKKERPVFTASSWQVRQPIYTTSCGRWQDYDPFIGQLKELLADCI